VTGPAARTAARPAILGGEPAFPEGLRFVRPPAPPLDRVMARLRPGYERGVLTNGPLVRELEEAATARLGVGHAVAVASCTSGLMLVLQAVADPDRPVLMPSFTFSATAHAAAWMGADPRFADCGREDFQLDVDDAGARLRTGDGVVGAIVATHVFGAPCHPERIEALGRSASVPVVFDAAHAFGATHQGRAVGGFGSAEVFSLSPTKPLVAGEGGLVTTHDGDLAERVRFGRDYGNPGDYDTRFAGLNARMSELHAAVALESLTELDAHLARRRRLAQRYRELLGPLPGLAVQRVDPAAESTYKDLTVVVDESRFGVARDDVVASLAAEGIDTRRYFWPPVHRQRAYRVLPPAELPATDWLAARVISLPLWRDLTDGDIEAIGTVMAGIHDHAAEIVRARPGSSLEDACAPS
jgi:dTDP-4-amino-4,6-dideoxygalactose transaminase